MCNYYDNHTDLDRKRRRFKVKAQLDLPNIEPYYVVRPTNRQHVVAVGKSGERQLVRMRWGLVPARTKPPKFVGRPLTNARLDTIKKGNALWNTPLAKGQRCLVPVDGFFEFTGPDGDKQPHYFAPKDGRIMAFAGIWDSWKGPSSPDIEPGHKDYAAADQPMLSFTFITTEANALMAPFHDRIPVLLTEENQFDAWLSPEFKLEDLVESLGAPADDLLATHPVTKMLLKTKTPGPELLEPIAA